MALRSDRGVVEELYRTYLGREADIGGLNFWLQTFGNDLSQDEIFSFIDGAVGAGELNPEQGEQFKAVTPLYLDMLNRLPDRGGLLYYAGQFGTDIDPGERQQFEIGARPELGVVEEPPPPAPTPEPTPPPPAPTPEPVAPPAPAAPTNVDSKGRPYNASDYENIKKQLTEQANAGVKHKASFSSNQTEIIDDMAKQLASYGVKSIYDLKQEIYTDLEYPTTTTDEAVEPTEVQKQRVINSATGQEIPLNELNNSRGSGFTYYKIEFADGIPVPYGYKENTGFSAFVDQVSDVAKPLTPALIAIAAPYLAGTGAALGATGTAAQVIDKAIAGALVSGVTGQDPLKGAVLASLGPITDAYGAQLGEFLLGQTAGAATVGSIVLSSIGSGVLASMTGQDVPKSMLAGAITGGFQANANDIAGAFLSKDQINSIASTVGLSPEQVVGVIGKAFVDGVKSVAVGGSGQDFIQTFGNSLVANGLGQRVGNEIKNALGTSLRPETIQQIAKTGAQLTSLVVNTAAAGEDVDVALQQQGAGIILTNVIEGAGDIRQTDEKAAADLKKVAGQFPGLMQEIAVLEDVSGNRMTDAQKLDYITNAIVTDMQQQTMSTQVAGLPVAIAVGRGLAELVKLGVNYVRSNPVLADRIMGAIGSIAANLGIGYTLAENAPGIGETSIEIDKDGITTVTITGNRTSGKSVTFTDLSPEEWERQEREFLNQLLGTKDVVVVDKRKPEQKVPEKPPEKPPEQPPEPSTVEAGGGGGGGGGGSAGAGAEGAPDAGGQATATEAGGAPSPEVAAPAPTSPSPPTSPAGIPGVEIPMSEVPVVSTTTTGTPESSGLTVGAGGAGNVEEALITDIINELANASSGLAGTGPLAPVPPDVSVSPPVPEVPVGPADGEVVVPPSTPGVGDEGVTITTGDLGGESNVETTLLESILSEGDGAPGPTTPGGEGAGGTTGGEGGDLGDTGDGDGEGAGDGGGVGPGAGGGEGGGEGGGTGGGTDEGTGPGSETGTGGGDGPGAGPGDGPGEGPGTGGDLTPAILSLITVPPTTTPPPREAPSTRVTPDALSGILKEKDPLFGGDEGPQIEDWNRRSLRLRRLLGL